MSFANSNSTFNFKVQQPVSTHSTPKGMGQMYLLVPESQSHEMKLQSGVKMLSEYFMRLRISKSLTMRVFCRNNDPQHGKNEHLLLACPDFDVFGPVVIEGPMMELIALLGSHVNLGTILANDLIHRSEFIKLHCNKRNVLVLDRLELYKQGHWKGELI
jgi:hypothetical protein